MREQVLLALLLSTTAAWGADVAVNGDTVTFQGEIKDGDFQQFKSKTASLNKAAVVLKSPGGKVLESLQIGEFVRQRGFSTRVDAYAYCLSACSMIWLAGKPRYMSGAAKIGLHAAFDVNGKESGLGNAFIGSYLTKLGFGQELISFAAMAAPKEMKYLLPGNAKRLGIDVVMTDELISPVAAATVSFTERERVALEAQVLKLVGTIVASFNTDKFPQLANQFYWDWANFNGKMTSKQDIFAEKVAFMERWPVRNYKIRSATAKCSGPLECQVTGVMDFEVKNGPETSSGSTEFSYTLRNSSLPSDRFKIAGESSKILIGSNQ
jgi:hypothetical protein